MSAATRPETTHASVAAMHKRLVLWGQVLLQGATGEELSENRTREPGTKTPWTPAQEEAAWAVDHQVNALQPKPRFVLRVFYRAWQAECWDEFEPDKQLEIEAQLCRELNARWRSYCCGIGELPRTIRSYQLLAIREAAVRELCERA